MDAIVVWIDYVYFITSLLRGEHFVVYKGIPYLNLAGIKRRKV